MAEQPNLHTHSAHEHRLMSLRQEERQMAGLSYMANFMAMGLIGTAFLIANPTIAIPAFIGGVALSMGSIVAGWRHHLVREEREGLEPKTSIVVARPAKTNDKHVDFHEYNSHGRADGKSWLAIHHQQQRERGEDAGLRKD